MKINGVEYHGQDAERMLEQALREVLEPAPREPEQELPRRFYERAEEE